MFSISCDVTQALEGLADFQRRAEDNFERAADRAGAAVQRRAKARCPVRTGYLRDSIHIKASGHGYNRHVEVGPEADYGIYVELGTSRTHAHPFMGPAWDETRPEFLRDIGRLGA